MGWWKPWARSHDQRAVTWDDLEEDFSPEIFNNVITSATGESVTARTATQITSVLACVRLISTTMATLPLILYKRAQEGSSRKQRDTKHPLYAVLHDQPNPEMGASEFWEFMVTHIELRGNAYAEKVRNNRGDVVALWPLNPDKMEVNRVDGSLVYKYQAPKGDGVLFSSDEILHIRMLPLDGVLGLSVIDQAKESLGLAKAGDKYAGKFFGNSAMPSGVLVTSEGKSLKPEAKARLAADWRQLYGGLDNAQRVAVLEDGLSYQQISVTPEQAQFLESRKYAVRDIARLFGVPAHLIGDLEQATFSNIEHQGIEFQIHSIRPRCVRIEQAIRRQLLKPQERGTWFSEYLLDALARGDLKTRYEAYQIARMNGWMNADEIRDRENMNPISSGLGSLYLMAANLVPLGDAPENQGDEATPPEPLARGAVSESADRGGFAGELKIAQEDGRRRRAIRRQYTPLMQEAWQKVVDRETKVINSLAEGTLPLYQKERFIKQITEYYNDDNRMAELLREQNIVLASYTDAISEQAISTLEQVGAENINTEALRAGMEDFRENWRAQNNRLYPQRNLGELRNLVLSADDDEGAMKLIQERMAEWTDKKGAKSADREVKQADGAVAREVFRRGGIKYLTWRAVGESCELCSQLDGLTVSIEGAFVPQGMMVDAKLGLVDIDNTPRPEGETQPVKAGADVLHPPLHRGCDCVMEMAMELTP